MADAAMTAARALLLLPALSVCAGNAPIGKSTVIVKVVAMLLAVVFPLLAVAAGDASVLLVSSWPSQNTVWRAFASGAAEPVLTLIERETTNEGLFLNGAALPSRNQRLVAFSSRHDLWILDVETGKRTRVTNVGKPYTSTEADVSARPALWSWDGTRILYEVQHGETEDPENNRAPLKVRRASYGLFVHDLSTGVFTMIPALAGRPLSWLPDDTILTLIDHKSLYQRHVKADSGSQKLRVSESSMQLSVGPDGKTILMTVAKAPFSQIVRIDLSGETWPASPVSPRGKWAEFQWPSYSPSGRRHAYSHRIERGMGILDFRLVVDGKSIFSYERAAYAWITDEVLAIAERESPKTTAIVVIDANSGREIARHEFQGK